MTDTTAQPCLDSQPYFATVRRIVDALAAAGAPLSSETTERLAVLAERNGQDEAEALLDERVLVDVTLDERGFATLRSGSAPPKLVERGWRTFLVRIANPHAVTAPLHLASNPIPGLRQAPAPGEFTEGFGLAQVPWNLDRLDKTGLVRDSWLRVELGDTAPLSGLPLEYRLLHLYSSSGQARTATIGLSAVADTLGLHSGNQLVWIDFEVEPSFDVIFDVRDEKGRTCVASLVIRDGQDRVYPPQAMRVAPDMRFQPQIYRGHGETVRLPAGYYTVEARRGPEYVPVRTSANVDGPDTTISLRLERWIDAEGYGWYSSDPHIHAAGCSHYLVPTEGVRPESMIRQVRGEGLALGGVLTWGPGYYHQKQFFTGEAISPEATLEYPDLQEANNQTFRTATTELDHSSALRYDLEVSGFPSSHLGHVMLLNLDDQDYPGTRMVNDWPSYTLPITRWGRDQGAVVGYAHCGFGLDVSSVDLPNHEMPLFNSIGANEAIIDVTHGTVDFIAGAEALPSMELNSWYHMLNSGFRIAMVGETDYPCIFDERPGVGRTYVAMDVPMDGGAGYPEWVAGLASGRLYFGDGRTHFLEFTVEDVHNGATLEMSEAGTVTVHAKVAARLEEEITDEIRAIRESPAYARPSWHLERARIGDSRTVPLELVVNGVAVERREIKADGAVQDLTFSVPVEKSSWIALRVLPSGHTHPTFVHVGGRPVRASRRSAQWCREAIDVIWDQKGRFVRDEERADAEAAFDFARRRYEEIAAECAEET